MATEQPDTRVEMKPAGAATGYVDGGWWPRSTDPASEFPGLIGALEGAVGRVTRVGYSLDFWQPVHRKLPVDGRVVKCQGYHTMNAHTVTVTGANSGRVTLLVVSPATPDNAAEAMVRSAAGQDNTDTVEEILAGSGVQTDQRATNPATPRRAPIADAIPKQRWENEGGSVHGGQPAANSAR